MCSVVIVLSLLITLAMSHPSTEDCVKYPDLCHDSQCCLMMADSEEGRCSERLLEDSACEMKPLLHPTVDGHEVYMNMCPCHDYLSCGESEDVAGSNECQADVTQENDSESDASHDTPELILTD